MKKFSSFVLALILLITLSAAAFAEPVKVSAVKPQTTTEIDDQIKLIYANLDQLNLDKGDNKWRYTVTDLDHNGRLELIAARIQGADRNTYVYVYQIDDDMEAFIQCDMGVKDGDPFVDIITDSADTFHNASDPAYYYLFTEGYASEEGKYYAVKCSISLEDNYITPMGYAYETTEYINGNVVITYADLQNNPITPDEFNAAGNNAFSGYTKTSTSFDWFTLDEVVSVARLTESYEVFTGERTLEKKSDEDPIILVPAPTEDPSNRYLTITRNPVSTHQIEGQDCWMTAEAINWDNALWTFVSPNGGEYSAQNFVNSFTNCTVRGVNSGNLCIEKVTPAMSGWGAYCTFYGNGQTTRSSTAYLTVSAKPITTPRPIINNYAEGYVTDFLMSTVTIYLYNYNTTIQVPKDICYVTNYGSIQIGSCATVYFTGNNLSASNVTSVYIDRMLDFSSMPYYDAPIW